MVFLYTLDNNGYDDGNDEERDGKVPTQLRWNLINLICATNLFDKKYIHIVVKFNEFWF